MQAGESYITTHEQINNIVSSSNKNIKILGQPISIEKLSYIDKRTNKEKYYFKSRIDLLDSEVETVCFNQNFNNIKLWDDHKLLVLDAYVRNRNNQMSIYFNDANMFEPNQNSNNNISGSTKSLLIEIDNININDSDFKNLVNLLNQSKGEMPVYIKMDDEIIEYNNFTTY